MRLHRTTAIIEIEDKHFEITVVPIGALILWDDISEKRIKMKTLLDKLIKDGEMQEAGKGWVRPDEYQELMELIDTDVEKTVLQILSMLLDHEANESEFDREWWLEHIDESRGLIEKAIQKDGVFQSKKKQRKVDWDMLYSLVNKHWRPVSWKEYFDLDFKELGNIVKLFPPGSGDLFLEADGSIKVSHMRIK